MAKYLIDAAMDSAFSYIRARVEYMLLCSTNPTTYAEAVSTHFLGSIALSAGDITHDDGSTDGRCMSVAAKASVPVSVAGSILHVVLTGSAGLSTVLFYTSSTAKAVTVGDAVNVPTFRDTIADAA